MNKLASLEATLVRNYDLLLTDLLTGVKCRATSVAKNSCVCNVCNCVLRYLYKFSSCLFFTRNASSEWSSYLIKYGKYCKSSKAEMFCWKLIYDWYISTVTKSQKCKVEMKLSVLTYDLMFIKCRYICMDGYLLGIFADIDQAFDLK